MFQQPLEQQYLQRHIYWCWGYTLCKEQWICIHRFVPLHIVFGNLRVGNLTQLYNYHKRKTFRPNFWGFPSGLNGKESACNEGDLGLIPRTGRPWLPTPVSLGLPQVMNLPAMWETRVHSLGQEDPLEKGMATHSSILAWRIPWIEEPGGLQSLGSQRIKHDWATYTLSTNHSGRSSPPLSSIQTAHLLPCVILLSGFYLCGIREPKTTKERRVK